MARSTICFRGVVGAILVRCARLLSLQRPLQCIGIKLIARGSVYVAVPIGRTNLPDSLAFSCGWLRQRPEP